MRRHMSAIADGGSLLAAYEGLGRISIDRNFLSWLLDNYTILELILLVSNRLIE